MRGSWNIKDLSNEELAELVKDIREEVEERQGKWDRYIEYLRGWADDNADIAYSGQSPMSYEQWDAYAYKDFTGNKEEVEK